MISSDKVRDDSADLQKLSHHLDKRLDDLSDKINAILAELSLRTSRTSRGDSFTPTTPRGNSGPSVMSPSAALWGPASPRINRKGIAMKLAEDSQCPSEISSNKNFNFGNETVKATTRPLSQRGLRAMDLDFARRLHAKEVCQEVAGSDSNKSLKPFLRLFEQSRSDRIWELLDDPRSSLAAWLLSQMLKLMVLTSVVLTTLQTSDFPVLETVPGQVADITFNVVFFVEFVCRFLSTPSKKMYVLDPLNLGDMVSALGLPLLATIGFSEGMPESGYGRVVSHILLLFMPLVRFLKLLRYFESFRLLVDAFTKSAEALPVLTYITAFMVLISGTLIYILEDRDNIPGMPHCLWLALVTMTTVGYGDYFPRSMGGYLTVSVLTFASVLFLALPVGIIGYEFTKTWQKRGEMFLKMRLRNSLAKWGYGIDDVEILFEYADGDEDGQLVLAEFIELIRQLRIGVNVQSAAALFHLLDSDHNGMLDRGEFLRHIFPDEYAKHTQQFNDESLSRSRRRIGMALERLESFNTAPLPEPEASSPVSQSAEPAFNLTLRSPNLTPEPQEPQEPQELQDPSPGGNQFSL